MRLIAEVRVVGAVAVPAALSVPLGDTYRALLDGGGVVVPDVSASR